MIMHMTASLVPSPQEVEGLWNSLEVQQLQPLTFTAEGLGSIPGQGTKIPQATWLGKKKKKANGLIWKTNN